MVLVDAVLTQAERVVLPVGKVVEYKRVTVCKLAVWIRKVGLLEEGVVALRERVARGVARVGVGWDPHGHVEVVEAVPAVEREVLLDAVPDHEVVRVLVVRALVVRAVDDVDDDVGRRSCARARAQQTGTL